MSRILLTASLLVIPTPDGVAIVYDRPDEANSGARRAFGRTLARLPQAPPRRRNAGIDGDSSADCYAPFCCMSRILLAASLLVAFAHSAIAAEVRLDRKRADTNRSLGAGGLFTR